ncbi:MAG TPA: MbcA/ParS/Xre antitoxin family protein [Pirellulales bacterium]|nr:MbcA/ParS/Xre antitoxin family protein [Pirellulales bacterium]
MDVDSDEKCEIGCLVRDIVDDPAKWMDTPNDQLGGRKPHEFVGTPQERLLRELLRSIKHGMPT